MLRFNYQISTEPTNIVILIVCNSLKINVERNKAY